MLACEDTALICLALLIGIGVIGLWERFRPDALPERRLPVLDLDDLGREYLDLIRLIQSGQADLATLMLLDVERQTTHDELLRRLELVQSSDLDVARFARRYLNRCDGQ